MNKVNHLIYSKRVSTDFQNFYMPGLSNQRERANIDCHYKILKLKYKNK